MEPAVVVKNLVKRFGDFVAVDNVSFSVPRGEIYGFLGPNGAGKTTTIRVLCGLLEPTSGEGQVAGFDIRTQREAIKSNIGYMSQRFSLYEDLKVEENIDFYAGIYRIPAGKREARKSWVLSMAGLEEHRQARTGVLSTGWKQRLALGCAILHEPPILFLDEPTSGVDAVSRRRFWNIIYDLSGRGVTVFVTTHYMDEAEYCGRLGLIYRGRLIASDTATALKTEKMRGYVLAIECDRPQEVVDAVAAIPGVREVALAGQGLHAVADETETAGKAIEDRLKRSRPNVRVKAIQPSLEDVFVAMVEARRPEGAARE